MAFSANPDRQLRSPFYSKLNLHHHVDTNVTSQISPPHCAVHKRVMDPFRMCFSVVWKHHDDSLRFCKHRRDSFLLLSSPLFHYTSRKSKSDQLYLTNCRQQSNYTTVDSGRVRREY
nr:hypothetical protein HmN_000566700 [Hymenolepis microstoma]